MSLGYKPTVANSGNIPDLDIEPERFKSVRPVNFGDVSETVEHVEDILKLDLDVLSESIAR